MIDGTTIAKTLYHMLAEPLTCAREKIQSYVVSAVSTENIMVSLLKSKCVNSYSKRDRLQHNSQATSHLSLCILYPVTAFLGNKRKRHRGGESVIINPPIVQPPCALFAMWILLHC